MERYETAFYTPLLPNWENHPNWRDNGGIDARTRTNTVWKELLRQYEPPVFAPPDHRGAGRFRGTPQI